ncbi:MAG: hypothetical protein WCW68_01615 [Methanothrix sp.]
MDALLTKVTALTGKAYKINIDVATKEVERAFKQVEKYAKDATNVGSSKAVAAHKAHASAAKGLEDTLSKVATQSKHASVTVGGFFSQLDSGRLVVAGAAAGLSLFAANAVKTYESLKLATSLVQDQMGSASSGLMSFINKGGQTSGTSLSGRAGLISYMSMTGYKDPKKMEQIATDAEKIMHSTFGKNLAAYGISDEKSLIQTLSNPIDENSDIGRMVKDKMPTFFTAGTFQTQKMTVQREKKYAFQSDEVVEAEARRRMMAQAAHAIAGGVTPDQDSYRRAADDMSEAMTTLNTNIGTSLEPSLTMITKLTTWIIKMASAAPEVTALAGSVVVLGTGLAILAAVLPMVQRGMMGVNASMLLNPVVLTVAAVSLLVAGLVALEGKTQIFSKAWDHFTNSEIGKDLIGGVKDLASYLGLIGEGGDFFGGLIGGIESFAGRIGSLFDQVDNIYKMFKGGNLTGALAGGLSLAFKVTPIGMAAQFAESLLPSKRVQDMILFVLQKMKDLWDGFTRWLNDIWQVVAKFLDPILKIFQYLKELKEKLLGGGGLTGDALKKAFTEALKSSSNPGLANASPEKAEAIYGAVSGEKPLTQDEKSRLQISDIELADAKKAYDKLKNPQPSILTQPGSVLANTATGAGKALWNAVPDVHTAAYNLLPKKTQAEVDSTLTREERLTKAGYSLAADGEYTDLNGNYLSDEEAKKASAIFYSPNALGGEVTKSGMAWIDEGEPIVPAEVARSSVLIDSLKSIASGGGAGPSGGVTVQIGEIKVVASGDANSIARQIKEALLREMDDFSFKSRVEAIVHRADRAYIA